MRLSLTAAMSAIALAGATGCSAGAARAQGQGAATPATQASAAHIDKAAAPKAPAIKIKAAVPPVDLLVLRGRRDARAVNAATGAVVSAAKNGLPTPAGALLVGTSTTGRLSLVDTRTGETTAAGGARAGLVPAVTTRDGREVALIAAPSKPRTSGYIAPARRVTHITVSGAREFGKSTAYDLQGNFEPEAFSDDGRQLFLVEYLPAMAPDRYRIRQLDLDAGTVNGVYGPQKTLLDEQMRGIGRMHVLDQGRAVLYTLYKTVGSDQAFVHTLHLDGNWAHCIVLPGDFGRGGADAVIALAPDGILYAWDGAVLAVIDGPNMLVRRTVAVRDRQPGTTPAIAIAPDGTVVTVAGQAVTELAGSSLEARPTWSFSLPAAVSDISVSPDGKRLYVAAGAQVVTFDRVSHNLLAEIRVVPGDRIAAVLEAG